MNNFSGSDGLPVAPSLKITGKSFFINESLYSLISYVLPFLSVNDYYPVVFESIVLP